MAMTKKYLEAAFVTLVGILIFTVWFTLFRTPPVTVYSIDATATDGGTISPAGQSTLVEGSSQTYTITPNAGYKVASVLIDGATTSATSSYIFNVITQNHSIQVSFVPKHYTIDTHGVYFKGQIAAGVDAKTFMVLGDYFGKDRRGVFYSHGERIPTADPISFKALPGESGYAMDREFVFWASHQVFDADVATFAILDETYATDKNAVYYTNEKIVDADKATFVFIGTFNSNPNRTT